MRMELLQMVNKYGDDRRTVLTYGIADETQGLPIEPIKVLMFENGSVFATQQKLESLDMKRKNFTIKSSARFHY